MAFKFNVLSLALVVLIGFAAVEGFGMMYQSCGSNEVFELCGSRCPVTCATLTAPPSCTGCAKGCFCRPGYYKDATGVCILGDNC